MTNVWVPNFEGLALRHAASARFSRVVAIVLIAVGVAISVGALITGQGWSVAAAGLVVAATAIFPFKDHLDHRDRILGLDVLADEWEEVTAMHADNATLVRLRAVVGKLYQ